MHNMNPMPMLTSLTLAYTKLEDEHEHANELNRCFPNLQVLKLKCVKGLKDPKIHLLHLQTCHWDTNRHVPSLTLITPRLITLTIECFHIPLLHVEAPMLSQFHLSIRFRLHMFQNALCLKKFENLKTLWLNSDSIGSILSQFPITTTVEDLTLHSEDGASRVARDSEFTLGKVFAVFPNVSSIRINSGAWSELEAFLNPEGWEILDGRKGLKRIHAYLNYVRPSLTFSFVACVLDQCVGLSEVSLLIRDYNVDTMSDDVVDTIPEDFMSKCMARWPRLKWRWGAWIDEGMEDSWITNSVSN